VTVLSLLSWIESGSQIQRSRVQFVFVQQAWVHIIVDCPGSLRHRPSTQSSAEVQAPPVGVDPFPPAIQPRNTGFDIPSASGTVSHVHELACPWQSLSLQQVLASSHEPWSSQTPSLQSLSCWQNDPPPPPPGEGWHDGTDPPNDVVLSAHAVSPVQSDWTQHDVPHVEPQPAAAASVMQRPPASVG
jgi:hypothetical protein